MQQNSQNWDLRLHRAKDPSGQCPIRSFTTYQRSRRSQDPKIFASNDETRRVLFKQHTEAALLSERSTEILRPGTINNSENATKAPMGREISRIGHLSYLVYLILRHSGLSFRRKGQPHEIKVRWHVSATHSCGLSDLHMRIWAAEKARDLEFFQRFVLKFESSNSTSQFRVCQQLKRSNWVYVQGRNEPDTHSS